MENIVSAYLTTPKNIVCWVNGVFLEDIDDFLQEFVFGHELDLLYRRWAGSQKYSKGKNLGFGRIQQFGSLKVPGLFLLEVRTQPNNYNRIYTICHKSEQVIKLYSIGLNRKLIEFELVFFLQNLAQDRLVTQTNQAFGLLSFQIKFEQATTRLMMYILLII